MLLVAPLVFRAPEAPAAVCTGGRRPAREIATREPDGSERSISRPALALPPPTGTATMPRHRPWVSQPVPSGPSGALHACHTNFACNSLVTISNVEFIALKSQRFQTLLNLHPIELHATLMGGRH